MPAAFSYAIAGAHHNWGYESEPEPHLDGRRILLPRGKVLGGSSSINAMAFVRGQKQDFDDWAAIGLPEWSYAHCLPYFKRLEQFSGSAGSYRGTEGPVRVTQPSGRNVLDGVFLEACAEAGFSLNRDVNGADQEGVGPMDQTLHKGVRASAATAYLDPARSRPNLQILTGQRVLRVALRRERAVGVEVSSGTADHMIEAGREVILSAGAANSPQLLMLSGIGDAASLNRHGIHTVADLPGVGCGVQDHADVSIKQACTQAVTTTPALRFPRNALLLARWLLFRTGDGATNHFETAGYIRSSSKQDRADVQICFMPLLVAYDGSAMIEPHGYMATVLGLRPKSRGALKLRSADPTDPPVIIPGYLSDPDDLRTLRDGLQQLRRIFAQPAFDSYRGKEVAPGAALTTDQDLDGFIRRTAKSTHHLSCSCRMGSDDDAVVDGEGRVRGIEGLRVIDASVFPAITSGNTNAPTLMVAEKLSDVILGKAPLAPEHGPHAP